MKKKKRTEEGEGGKGGEEEGGGMGGGEGYRKFYTQPNYHSSIRGENSSYVMVSWIVVLSSLLPPLAMVP